MHRSVRLALRGLLAGCVVSCLATGQALAHGGDDACGGSIEDELRPIIREASSALRVSWRAAHAWGKHGTTRVQILGINDFHGRLTTGLKVGARPVGGAAVLASYLRNEQAAFTGDTFIVHAGDQVGASPPESALLQDEPAIEWLNMLTNKSCKVLHGILAQCNVIGTLGNHELDEGSNEALRLIYGGKHARGPFLSDPYPGAQFPYISSNVLSDGKHPHELLPPFVVRFAGGEPIAFIGAVLEAAPTIISADGVKGLKFVDEADAINKQVKFLKAIGINAIVVLLHQGGPEASYTGPTKSDATGPTGDIVDVVSRLDSAVDVVVSGHSHTFTNALMQNSEGHPILITQAFSSGTAYGDIELTIDHQTHDIVEKSAQIVTTFGDAGPGLTPAQDVAELVQRASDRVAPLVNRVVGESSVAITRTPSASGETNMGNLIADAQRAAMNAQIALMNPGGIRADLDVGPVTWGELFTIQPFGNTLVKLDLTGAQLKATLEQMWSNPTQPRILQVSGIKFSYQASAAPGSRILSLEVNGAALDASATYSVVANSFLAGGGDGFTTLASGTNRVIGPVDLDALVDHVSAQTSALAPAVEGRITNVP
jgi:5'-nucleotidase